MSELELNQMFKIEVVISGNDQDTVTNMMKDEGITGYTVIPNISGFGHYGHHQGQMFFNDKSSFVMIIAVAPEDVIARVAEGLEALFKGKPGVLFVSEVSVARVTYFS